MHNILFPGDCNSELLLANIELPYLNIGKTIVKTLVDLIH